MLIGWCGFHYTWNYVNRLDFSRNEATLWTGFRLNSGPFWRVGGTEGVIGTRWPCVRPYLSFVETVTVTTTWARWRLKSPASPLFTQPFIQAQIKETSKLRVTGLFVGNSPVTGEFPAQMASNAENVSIWWRHHGYPANIRTLKTRATNCFCWRLCFCKIKNFLNGEINGALVTSTPGHPDLRMIVVNPFTC